MNRPSTSLCVHRDEIRRIVAKNQAVNARVFGSALDGNDGENSDLDILVDALPGTTLFDLGAIQVELEELLGVPVDVATPGDLSPKFRQEVLNKAQPI